MSTRVWQVVTELTLRGDADDYEQLCESLAAALSRLSVPQPFVERLRAALLEVTNKIGAVGEERGTGTKLAVRFALPTEDTVSAQSGWGFFIVTKGGSGGEEYGIDIILYHDIR